MTIVVSGVVSAVTMLPTASRRYDTRPAIGAVTRVNERLSSCVCTVASAAARSAAACSFAAIAHLGVGLAHELRFDERFRALELRVRVRELRLRTRDLGFCVRELRRIRPRVDHEQELALLHDLAVVEVHGLDRARDPRPHLDRVDGLEAAGIVVPVGHALGQRRRDFHGRRRVGRRRGLAARGAQRTDECGQQSDRPDSHCSTHRRERRNNSSPPPPLATRARLGMSSFAKVLRVLS